MSDKIRVVLDKYQEGINRFNNESKNKVYLKENNISYQIRCFPNFGELRFYIFLDKLYKDDYTKNMSSTVYIEMEDLEKQNIYSVDKIYKNLKELINEIYKGEENE